MLSGKQRHYLRGLGHGLRPIVMIGKGGLDAGLYAAVEQALLDHELIKIRLGEHADVDRHEAADAIAGKTKSEVAQVLGHVLLLYRAHPDKPVIEIPIKGAKPAPKAGKLAAKAPSSHKAGRPAPTRPTGKTGLKKRDRRAD